MAEPLSAQINQIMSMYSKEITDGIKENAEAMAEKTVQELKNTSPKRKRKGGGRYARRWASKKAFESASDIRYTVYNKSPTYRLTHLLENGHRKKGGGKVAAKVHIKPVEEWMKKEFEKMARRTVDNAAK